MLQKDYVIEAMRANGGYATFQQLNKLVDYSSWGTKTPAATIRAIVQKNDEFFRIQPGLWALKEYENEVNKKFKIQSKSEKIYSTTINLSSGDKAITSITDI